MLMKKVLGLVMIVLICHSMEGWAQDLRDIVSDDDLSFLKMMTVTVIDSSCVHTGQSVSIFSGQNKTGGTLILPGARGCYPAFWIRDYAMALDCGIIAQKAQQHMLNVTAKTQCTQTWITKNGCLIPFGSVADHVRINDGLPVYFPGTYSYEEQGDGRWGMTPPYTDQFLFIHMAYCYTRMFEMSKVLRKSIGGYELMNRLEWSFNVPPSHKDNQIVYTTSDFRGVDFGFRDAIVIEGDLAISSVYKYRAAKEMAELFGLLGNKVKMKYYNNVAAALKKNIPVVFCNKRGLLMAGTKLGRQGDVWSTALAVYFGILENEDKEKACRALAEGYKHKMLSYKGNIRHVMCDEDFSELSMWEVGKQNNLPKKGTYQNGAYWGTATGWVCYAIAQVDMAAAQQLAKEYITDLRENDFRQGGNCGAPYECFNVDYAQNPIYMTTVASSLDAFLVMKGQSWWQKKSNELTGLTTFGGGGSESSYFDTIDSAITEESLNPLKTRVEEMNHTPDVEH